MTHRIGDFLLRKPEPKDVEALYLYKNDPGIEAMLSSFSTGYSRLDVKDWLERRRNAPDEVLWIIADATDDRAVGHVGLHGIDHRVRSAELGLVLGDRDVWGEGLGRDCATFAIHYGFSELNLNRISVHVIDTNERAHRFYTALGFQDEGTLRDAQFQGGEYRGLRVLSILKREHADRD